MTESQPRITHVFFGQVRKLSPLMAELRSFAGTYGQILIVPEYDQAPDYLAQMLPQVEIVYLKMRSRRWSARQTPLLKLLRFIEFTLRGMRAVRRSRADVIVAHDMPAVLPLLPRLLVRPSTVIFHAHELWTEAAENNAPLRPLWRMLERWTVRRAAGIVVPEIHRAQILHDEYGAPALPSVVMNIPPDPPAFERGQALRERFDLDPDDVIVLYQGLLDETRCIFELVDAMTFLPARMHLVLIGMGDDAFMQRLNTAAQAAEGRVHVIAWMHPEELRRHTVSADMGVLLYRNRGRNNYYAAPNKIFEYLFAGLPLVASNFPGLQSVVESGGYGSCADPERPEDIARAIVEAARIPAGPEIAQRARAAWRWSDQADVLRSVYQHVMKSTHAE